MDTIMLTDQEVAGKHQGVLFWSADNPR